MNTLCKCGNVIWDGTLICDSCYERDNAILNIYKTDDYTAEILVTEGGVVLDVQLTIKPLSDFGRRMRERQRTPARYKNKMPYEGQAKPLPVEPYRDKPPKPKPMINDRAFTFDNVNF